MTSLKKQTAGALLAGSILTLFALALPASAGSTYQDYGDYHPQPHDTLASSPGSDDWYLHRPSTPQERAETRRLNQEALSSSQASMGESDLDGRRPSSAEAHYRRELSEYRAAQRAYDQRMAAYAQAYAPQYGDPRYQYGGSAGIAQMPPANYDRAEPGYGYAPYYRPGNGYGN